jgi:hypothetical protein
MPYDLELPNGVILKDIPDKIPDSEIRRRVLKEYPELSEKMSRTLGETGKDVFYGLSKGIGQLAQLPGQVGALTGITSPDETTGLQGFGKKMEDISQREKSPVLQAKETMRERKLQEADGFLQETGIAIKSTITDPTLLSSFFFEQIPNLIGVGGFGALTRGGTKLLMRSATEEALAKAGVRGAIGGGAVMQGADVGTDTYNQIYAELKKRNPSMPDSEAQGIALAKGRVAAIEAAGISIATANMPGGASIERALAGRSIPAGGLLKNVFGEALSEGIEEGGGALSKNIGVKQVFPETDLMQGVGTATGLGTVGGALFGGLGGISGSTPPPQSVPLVQPLQAPRQPQGNLALEPQAPPAPPPVPPAPPAPPVDLSPVEQPPVPPTASERAAAMPGFTGARNVNNELVDQFGQTREDYKLLVQQEPEARKQLINEVLNTTYDQDGFKNSVIQKRLIAEIEAGAITAPEQVAPAQAVQQPVQQAPQTPADVALSIEEQQRLQAIQEAELEDVDVKLDKSRTTRKPDQTKVLDYTQAELEQMGFPPKETAALPPAYTPENNPDNLGIGNKLISEGGQPYTTKREADAARKAIPDMRVILTPNGYVLSPKSDAQLAAQAKSKLGLPSVGKKGFPLSAHEFIVSEGGLNPRVAADTNFPDQNPQVGNRKLFQTNGLTLDQAGERLAEAGYLPQDQPYTENDVLEVLDRSFKTGAYTPEGYNQIGEMQTEEEKKVYERQQAEEELFTPHYDEFDYAYAEDLYNRPMGELLNASDDAGIDAEAIAERLANEMQEATQEEYEDAVKAAISVATSNASNSAPAEIQQFKEELRVAAEEPATADIPLEEVAPIISAESIPFEVEPQKPPVLKAPADLKLKRGRNEQIVLAARELAAGRITKQQYDQYVDYYMPINLVKNPEPPLDKAGMNEVLKSNQVEKIDAPIAAGTKIGSRMDINALERGRLKGLNGSVVAIHPQNKPKTTLSYAGAVHLTNVQFTIRSEQAAMTVAMNEADKAPQQTIEGSWVPTKPKAIYAKVQELLNDPQWKQVSLDPLRHSFFYDRATKQPVVSADEVYQVGRFVLAKNPVYEERNEFLYMRKANDQEKNTADSLAKDIGGYVVWQEGKLGLIRGFAGLTGEPLYSVMNNGYRSKFDIKSYTGNLITSDERAYLLNIRDEIEAQDAANHLKKPFIKFNKDGVSASQNVAPELTSVLTGWKNILNIDAKIYVTTIADARANVEKFTGPHRVIASAGLNPNLLGAMRRMPDGNYYIAFQPNASTASMLETLAHELGHIHEREVFNNASPEVKEKILDEYNKWLSSQKDKTAIELVQSLRARKVGKSNLENLKKYSAKDLTSYWKSFGEWYADQVSRWATTSEKPLGVVEKFFARLGAALKAFYAKLRNAKYLPTETFKKYLESANQSTRTEGIIGQAEMFMQEQYQLLPTSEAVKGKVKQALQKRPPMNVDAFAGIDQDVVNGVQQVFFAPNQTIVDRLDGMKGKFFQILAQKTVDQFRTIRDFSPVGYMQARLSTATDGALEGLLFHGHVFNDGGALNIKQNTKGMLDALAPLGNEVDRFHVWMALNREAQLPEQKRSPSLANLIGSRDQFNTGTIDGKSRADVYEKARKDLMAINKSVLNIARDTGTIDQEAYDRFAADAFYVPFYKAMEDGEIESIRTASRLTNQEFSKELKGGSDKPFGDLMENVLRNWSHILSASMKNQAAVTIVKDAMDAGAVDPNLKAGLEMVYTTKPNGDREGKLYSTQSGEMIGNGELIQMREDESGNQYPVNFTTSGKGTVNVQMDGMTTYFKVNDPLLLESIGAINYMNSNGKVTEVLRTFKNVLRFGVTVSPIFKVNNLIKDSVQAAGVSGIGFNLVKNVMSGLSDSGKDSPIYQSALAGGGIFNYGSTLEGDRSKAIRKLIDKGVAEGTILDTKEKIQNALSIVWNKYEDLGNKSEAANRIALYKRLIAEGKSHLEASYQARDLMDYSMQGSSGAMRWLTQVVPFLGARATGLYKLGRDGVIPTARVFYNTLTGKPIDQTDAQKAKTFSTVAMTASLASMALYLAFKDDEDFKKREQWDRDYFWWFKVPGTDLAFRIPKPFEIGAIATLAERTLEQIVDDSAESKMFTESLSKMVWQTFSLNPTPQFFKPLIDLYANKESFTGAPIETAGMERLSKQERKTDQTSPLAIALGGVSNALSNVLGKESEMSPAQIDYLIRSYLGWFGGTIQTTTQYAVMPFSNGVYPDADWTKRVSLGFLQNLPATQSTYVTQFYHNNQLIQQAYADMRHYAELGQSERVKEILEEKGDLIRLQSLYDQKTKVMANIRKQLLRVSDPNNDTMTGAEKKEEIERLKSLISDQAKQAEDIRKNFNK